jgi:hypothetical protein
MKAEANAMWCLIQWRESKTVRNEEMKENDNE